MSIEAFEISLNVFSLLHKNITFMQLIIFHCFRPNEVIFQSDTLKIYNLCMKVSLFHITFCKMTEKLSQHGEPTIFLVI